MTFYKERQMHSFIDFITGPMVWISFAICILGTIFRLYAYYSLLKEKENFIVRYLSPKYGFRSIFAWLVPYLPQSTRIHPVFYGVSYIFHLLIFLVPIFLLAHIIMIEEAIPVSWIAISDPVADILTLVVLGALVFFTIRRLTVPEVKFLTRKSDFVFIGLVALPFLTGFIAYHQFFAYRFMVIAHVISGELLLILIPFTRFFHMILAPFTRAYIGSEFGYVRQTKDW